MYYGTTYQMQYEAMPKTGIDGTIMTINFHDTTTQSVTPITQNIIALTAAEKALQLSTVNDGEKKFSPIRAKQATFQFVSTETENLNLFSQGEDNRWLVTVTAGLFNTLFKGYILQDEIQEDFLDSDIGNIVTLTATDNIALLRDVKLTDFTGANPKGHYKIIEFIAFCLSKTLLQLPINVVNNIKEEHDSSYPFYHTCYLEAKTFESGEIGESINCYEVLEQILKNQCYLTQRGGAWWIVRTDEQERDNYRVYFYNAQGVFVANTNDQLIQTIGYDEDIEFLNEETFVEVERQLKSVELNYPYEYPKEIVDNIDFKRGAIYTPLSFPAGETWYHVEDWTLHRRIPDATLQAIAYIKRKIVDGYEKERYVVIGTAPIEDYYYLRSNAFPVVEKDKITVSVDFKYSTGIGSEFESDVIGIWLLADGGGIYKLEAKQGRYTNPPIWQGSNNQVRYVFSPGEDETQWTSVSVEVPPMPASGEIVILLFHQYKNNEAERHFTNLQISYNPFINGSYQTYRGQSYHVEQSGNYKAKLKDEVAISDSPRQLFKGALKYFDGTKYRLCGRFYSDAAAPSSTLPADDFLHPIGQIQVMDVWNQNNRAMRRFDFKTWGLRLDNVVPDITDQFKINAVHPSSSNKQFQLLHMEQDVDNGEMTGVLAEVFDTTIDKQYPIAGFKYTEDR